MKLILSLLLFFAFIKADDLYLTSYIYSYHLTTNDSINEKFNDTHKAYGLEYIANSQYSLTYNHFINSRSKDVDVYAAGYLFNFNKSFGLHLIGGYQRGYCFDGLLNSLECREGKDNTSAFVLPLLYYKHKYFKLDLFTNSDMIAFRLNIKIY